MQDKLYFDTTNKPRGVKRLQLATGHSFRAIKWLIQNESAFRQECVALLIAIAIVCIWPFSITEKAVLLVSVLFVMFAEIINTAVEATVDRVSLEMHPLAGLAKDLGSAGVLVAMLIASIAWITVILRHVF